jgi:hypothetical protein
MSKPIILTHRQWDKLSYRLTKDYGLSVMLLSYRMKDKLGFTVRNYREWSHQHGSIEDIRLDFYNESKRTMFLLKYSEYLDKTGITDS